MTPKHDMLVIVGDFNAKVGSRHPAEDFTVGSYGLGNRNDAEQRLVHFCTESDLVIANTMFEQPPRHLYTWTSPDGKTCYEID